MTEGILEINVHGMTKLQAQTAIDARLRHCPGSVYRLRIIHGYHGGTVIRDMVRTRYAGKGRVLRMELGLNPGETDLILREL